ncbi:hypothetical protein ENBRE01_2571, partial [Enteropsectra breve]
MNAIFDPRLIDNIIKYNALEFTLTGLGFYPRDCRAARDDLIKYLIDEHYEYLKEETDSGSYHVKRLDVDPSRYSYPLYKTILKQKGPIFSTDFNDFARNTPAYNSDPRKLPSFIYDAILKILFTTTTAHFKDLPEKITTIATFFSTVYFNEPNLSDFLRETYKVKSCVDSVLRSSIAVYIQKDDFETAIFLFKNLPTLFGVEATIEKFQEINKLSVLLEGIKKFEFVNWENETAIYNLVNTESPADMNTLLMRMSTEASCFFGIPKRLVEHAIGTFYRNNKNYKNIGSLAFVCKNTELLESLKDDIDDILKNWGFALNFHKFFSGVFSEQGKKSILKLPFFQMYYEKLFVWLDENIESNDVALKISRMLMVAKLAVRDEPVPMEVDSSETTNDDGVVPGAERMETSSTFSISAGMNILKAVTRTKVGYQAFCALHFYLDESFKKELDEKILPEIVAIEGAVSDELLKAIELRGYYKKLLKLQEGLNTKVSQTEKCSEEEMDKFLDMLSVLEQI